MPSPELGLCPETEEAKTNPRNSEGKWARPGAGIIINSILCQGNGQSFKQCTHVT